MFTPIQEELNELIMVIEGMIDFVAEMRMGENNNPRYIEIGGRLIGLNEALAEVEKTKIYINEHIMDILNNTIDGNFSKKIDVLTEENEVLKEKVSLLQNDLKKFSTQKAYKKRNKEPRRIQEIKDNQEEDKTDEE